MAKVLRFYGSSDDNFCYDVNGKPTDEIGAYGRPAAYLLTNPASPVAGAAVYIIGVYAESPAEHVQSHCWDIWPKFMVDEDAPGYEIPGWPIKFVKAHEYSVGLEITVPDSVVVSHWQEEEETTAGWKP